MPPNVLPIVATIITGQNIEGEEATTANTAGSDPIGNNVADTKQMIKTDVSPISGIARYDINQ